MYYEEKSLVDFCRQWVHIMQIDILHNPDWVWARDSPPTPHMHGFGGPWTPLTKAFGPRRAYCTVRYGPATHPYMQIWPYTRLHKVGYAPETHLHMVWGPGLPGRWVLTLDSPTVWYGPWFMGPGLPGRLWFGHRLFYCWVWARDSPYTHGFGALNTLADRFWP